MLTIYIYPYNVFCDIDRLISYRIPYVIYIPRMIFYAVISTSSGWVMMSGWLDGWVGWSVAVLRHYIPGTEHVF